MKNYDKINYNAEQIATAIYESIRAEPPSVKSLISWVEENFLIRIKVVYSDLSGKLCAGLVHYDPTINGYKIWINISDLVYRQRFTICHEIGHIIKNRGLSSGYFSDIYSEWGEERFCNRFAAAFLMPSELFIKKWNSCLENDILKKARMAQFFNVSADAVYYRAKELKLI